MNKKTVKKAAKRVTSTKRKPGPKPDPASERMAFRLTLAEKEHFHQLAVAANRTDSNYTRDLVVNHLKENPPPE